MFYLVILLTHGLFDFSFQHCTLAGVCFLEQKKVGKLSIIDSAWSLHRGRRCECDIWLCEMDVFFYLFVFCFCMV